MSGHPPPAPPTVPTSPTPLDAPFTRIYDAPFTRVYDALHRMASKQLAKRGGGVYRWSIR